MFRTFQTFLTRRGCFLISKGEKDIVIRVTERRSPVTLKQRYLPGTLESCGLYESTRAQASLIIAPLRVRSGLMSTRMLNRPPSSPGITLIILRRCENCQIIARQFRTVLLFPLAKCLVPFKRPTVILVSQRYPVPSCKLKNVN